MSTSPETKTLRLIGYASSRGAPAGGTAQGPDALRRLGLEARLNRRGVAAAWQGFLYPQPGATDTAVVAELCGRLAGETSRAVTAAERFAVFGGDHSAAIGTWSGAAAGLSRRGPLGLIWIDAHLDAHIPATSPSGALHGMPLACLLGFGPSALVQLGGFSPKLSPRQVCLIGVHSYEPAERAFLEWLGVKVFYRDEVSQRGLGAVLDEAVRIVRNGTAGFGVSIDLDVIDPRYAPGVTTPAPGGLRGTDLVRALGRLQANPAFIGLELAELDPQRDRNRATAYLASELALSALSPEPRADRERLLSLTETHGAANYDSLPVILSRGEGVHLWDVDGRRYLDLMGAYSAASHGHAHPRLVRVLAEQAQRLTITSRAFHNDRLGPFLQRLCELTGQDKALPVNTGVEAVETALKAARRWAYRVKCVPTERAEIIACRGAFHGRTLAAVALSSEPKYREGFGPFPPGFRLIPYGDAAALAEAITENTAAFLVEPIQGEGGLVVPPAGYLAECARICREQRVLLLCDEIQTGLGRTGRFLASRHEGVQPDGLMLGKALGGGLLPVSAFLASRELMGVFEPGSHGSTFGGNPLAAAVGLEALDVIVDEGLPERAFELGDYLLDRLRTLESPLVADIRGKGLFVGLELAAGLSGREFCLKLAERGILTRETRGTVIRLAPPLIIGPDALAFAVEKIGETLREWEKAL
jgi:ornithine--oxo-acid transaminase